MALTALQIKNAREGMHADGGGLYLRVQASGAKSWIFRYQVAGRRREMGLGKLSDKPAPAARAEVAQLRAALASGSDPMALRDAQRQSTTEAEAVPTFRQLAADYIDSHKAGWQNVKHAQQWTNTLETYAVPVIGNLQAKDVTTDHIVRILRPLWSEKTETASRLRARIEQVLNYAKSRGLRSGENPALWRGHLDTILPRPERIATVEHMPALPYRLASAFLAELRQVPGMGARALEFVMLTAVRSGDVRGATWAEINLDDRIWRIPRERQKIRDRALDDHYVPLSRPALRLLAALPRRGGEGYIFPNSKGEPLSDMALSVVIRRMNARAIRDGQEPRWIDPTTPAKRDATPHGFRSTFRDWAAEVGEYPRDLAEQALAHSIPDKVEAAYRRGSMLERRRPMMDAWATYLEGQPERTAASAPRPRSTRPA